MAHLAGKSGYVDTGSAVSGIKSWTLDYTADILETTDFADVGIKTYIIGGSGWSGSFEGFKDAAPLALAVGGVVAPIALVLKENQTSTQWWSGTAFITGIHINTSDDGIVTYGYDFQGTAGLTVAST